VARDWEDIGPLGWATGAQLAPDFRAVAVGCTQDPGYGEGDTGLCHVGAVGEGVRVMLANSPEHLGSAGGPVFGRSTPQQ